MKRRLIKRRPAVVDTSEFKLGEISMMCKRLEGMHKKGISQLSAWRADREVTNLHLLETSLNNLAWAVASAQACEKNLQKFKKSQRR